MNKYVNSCVLAIPKLKTKKMINNKMKQKSNKRYQKKNKILIINKILVNYLKINILIIKQRHFMEI